MWLPPPHLAEHSEILLKNQPGAQRSAHYIDNDTDNKNIEALQEHCPQNAQRLVWRRAGNPTVSDNPVEQ